MPPTPPEDRIATLISQAQAGNADAFEELFIEIRPQLEGWIASRLGARLRTRLDVEDIVQEAQLHAFRSLGSFTSDDPARDIWRWLGTIVNNRIRDLHDHHFKALKRDPGREARLQTDLSNAMTTPTGKLHRSENHELFLIALRDLQERDRDVIRLCSLEGRTYREAAAVLGITPENVSARLARAKTRLAKALKQIASDTQW